MLQDSGTGHIFSLFKRTHSPALYIYKLISCCLFYLDLFSEQEATAWRLTLSLEAPKSTCKPGQGVGDERGSFSD